MKNRQDAWSHDDDILLAETVLRHVRDGSTQVAAFEEVGDQLNRTSAACGYRWNAEVRVQYVQAVELAKKQRKEKKRLAESNDNIQGQVPQSQRSVSELKETGVLPSEKHQEISSNDATIPNLTLDDCIAFLRHYQTEMNPVLRDENNRLKLENQVLKKKHEELRLKYDQHMKNTQKIEHDYKLLMNILNQARNMSELSDKSYQTIH
jgi:prespore-specific regulator